MADISIDIKVDTASIKRATEAIENITKEIDEFGVSLDDAVDALSTMSRYVPRPTGYFPKWADWSEPETNELIEKVVEYRELMNYKDGAIEENPNEEMKWVNLLPDWNDYKGFGFERYDEYVQWLENGEDKMGKNSPFRTGRVDESERSSGNGLGFVKIEDGQSLGLVPLVGLNELVSCDLHAYWNVRPAVFHPCIGRDCPGCAAENEPRFKGYMPVLNRDGEVQVWPFSISVYDALEELSNELSDDEDDAPLKGFLVKYSRKGTGLKTRYTVLGTGKRIDNVDEYEIPEFVDKLGPTTRKEIAELLAENKIYYDDEVLGGSSSSDDTEAPWDDDDSDDPWGDI